MGIRSLLAKPVAKYVTNDIKKWSSKPVETQFKVFHHLLQNLKKTTFGKEKDLGKVSTYEEFKKRVPIQDYEGFIPYINQIKKGDLNVLWPGRPLYFAKTSGTTSGIKYIPLTKESVPYHINSARNAILCYVKETGKADFLDKKLIFLSGSPELDKSGIVPYGRLSGIASDMVPAYLRSNQLPSYATNCIEDWEEKLEKIIDETIDQPMSLISGIPPWVQMYFDRIQARTGKKIKDVFSDFELFIYGGVNFEPYKAKLFESIGKQIPSIETYPALEGFIAYQDSQTKEGLLLLLDNGMFYEFIPLEEYYNENPTRLHIGEVELGKNYAIILNTNAGLWGYSIGDTVKFVSKTPYRIVVTGRVKHFISAFGEHVIGEEVEKAIQNTMKLFPKTELVEFTVAPQVTPTEGLPYHEWLVEFNRLPNDLEAFVTELDKQMVQLNTYYNDLITGNILRPLKLTPLRKGAFIDYMKSIGKLGGQNKVPRLANDRRIADDLNAYKLEEMSQPLRIVFMGTPEFAVSSLDILVQNGYNVVGVVTAPDKPAGRGLQLTHSPIKEYALSKGLKVLQPEKLKDAAFIEELRGLQADVQVVVAFRMLPEVVWDMPSKGTFNLHASLLPQYRGAAPINWAIINGEKETGVTTFFLQHEIDTGDIIFQEKEPICETDNIGTLYERMMHKGAKLVLKTIEAIAKGEVKTQAQIPTSSSKPAPKIFKEHCRIDWNKTAKEVHNLIRGLSPYPTAFFLLNGKICKVFASQIKDVQTNNNQTLKFKTDNKTYLDIFCVDSSLSILELQLEGKKKMGIEEFLRGTKVESIE